MSGRRDDAVEFKPTVLNLLGKFVAADMVGTGFSGLRFFIALGKNQDRERFDPCRDGQNDRTADHLVGVLRIDTQVDCQIDALVELGIRHSLQKLESLAHRIKVERPRAARKTL